MMSERAASQAERAAEARARRLLLALARRNGWPPLPPQYAPLSGTVGGPISWERLAAELPPAGVVVVMHELYCAGA